MSDENKENFFINFDELNEKIFNLFKSKKKISLDKLEIIIKEVIDDVIKS